MTYAGLIIDGPMDGQRIDNRTEKLQVDVRAPLKLAPTKTVEEMAATAADITTATYIHHRTRGGAGLWLLEGETVENAVKHMVNRVGIEGLAMEYERVTIREREERERG